MTWNRLSIARVHGPACRVLPIVDKRVREVMFQYKPSTHYVLPSCLLQNATAICLWVLSITNNVFFRERGGAAKRGVFALPEPGIFPVLMDRFALLLITNTINDVNRSKATDNFAKKSIRHIVKKKEKQMRRKQGVTRKPTRTYRTPGHTYHATTLYHPHVGWYG